jgi:hypothetical protein
MTAIKITINKSETCDHLTIEARVGGILKKSFTTTLTDLKMLANDVDNVDAVLAQIRHTIYDNPTATMAQLKTKIEAEVYYV